MNLNRPLRSKQLPIIFFAAIACVLLSPNLLFGVRDAHDIQYHLMLFMSYRDAFQFGAPYPRWLPDQLHGLGSPALMFYPPLASAFFVLIDALTLHALAPERVLGAGAALLSAASAGSFFVWARRCGEVRVAAVAALFYATAPYHLNVDLYARGAMAEYAAFVWIPLIFLGIKITMDEGSAKGGALLIAGTSALLLTHLLTAMLIAPLALAYSVACLRPGPQAAGGSPARRFWLVALAATLGAALTALYYLPAVALLSEANAGGLYREVATTNIFFALRSLSDRFKLKLLAFACLYLACFIYLLAETIASRRRRQASGHATMLSLLWIGAGILCFALMSGVFPFVFRPPSPYAQVQFGWRLLVVMEFSLASLFVGAVSAAGDEARRRRMLKVALAVLLPLLALQLTDIAARFHKHAMFANPMQDAAEVKWRLSPIEYFPAGTKTGQPVDVAIRPFEHYATAATPAFVDAAKGRIVDARRAGARFTVRSVGSEPMPVMIQQFYFPGWKASDESGRELAVFRTEESRLATYIAPAGDHTVTVERSPTPQEHWGNMISLAALLGVALTIGVLTLRRKRSAGAPLIDGILRPQPGLGRAKSP
jgi:hypothetical protein